MKIGFKSVCFRCYSKRDNSKTPTVPLLEPGLRTSRILDLNLKFIQSQILYLTPIDNRNFVYIKWRRDSFKQNSSHFRCRKF